MLFKLTEDLFRRKVDTGLNIQFFENDISGEYNFTKFKTQNTHYTYFRTLNNLLEFRRTMNVN